MTMRIQTSDRLGGQPITMVRKLVRYLRDDSIAVENVMHVLSLERLPATRLLNAMVTAGIVMLDPRGSVHRVL